MQQLHDTLDAAKFPIGRLYEWLTRRSYQGTKINGGRAVLVRCIRPSAHKHGDKDPSLKLNLEDNVFNCFGCHLSGGVLDMIIAAGRADGRPERAEYERAMGWLKEQMGIDHRGPLEKQPPSTRKRRKIDPNANEHVADVFRYLDEHGEVLYTVLKIVGVNKLGERAKRFEAFQPAQPRTFPHERVKEESRYPDASGKHAFSIRMIVGRERGEVRWEIAHANGHIEHVLMHVRGVRIVPYNLPAIVRARRDGRVVFFLEGETDAKTLEKLGLIATSSPFGSGFTVTERWQSYFRGVGGLFNVADADLAGRRGAYKRHEALSPVVKRAAIVDPFPERVDGFDLTDLVRQRQAAGDSDLAIRRAIEQLAADALRSGPIPPSVKRALEATPAPGTDASAAIAPTPPAASWDPATPEAAAPVPDGPTADEPTIERIGADPVEPPSSDDGLDETVVSAEPCGDRDEVPIAPEQVPAAATPGRVSLRRRASAPNVPQVSGPPAIPGVLAARGGALVAAPAAIIEELYVAMLPRAGGAMRVVPLVQWEEYPSPSFLVSRPMAHDDAIMLDPARYEWLEPDSLARTLPKVATR